MPQLYNTAVVTGAGLSLMDRAQAGIASIQFTRMATGNGTYTADEKTPSALKMCTTLKSEKNSYPLSSVGVVPGGGVKLTALITNQDPATGATLVNEGYHINEIGLYAREKGGSDDTEVLYSITVAAYDTGDYMPAYTDGAPAQIVQEYRAKVGHTTEVSINSAGAVMLAEDAEELAGALRGEMSRIAGELERIDGRRVSAGDTDFYTEVTNLVDPSAWMHDTYLVDHGNAPRQRASNSYHAIKIPVKKGRHYSANGYINRSFSFFDEGYSEMSRSKLTVSGCTVTGVRDPFIGLRDFVPESDGYLSLTTNDIHYNDLSVIESQDQPVCHTDFGEVYSMGLGGVPIKPAMDIYVSADGTRGFSRLKDALEYVDAHANIKFTVHVGKGVYDLIEEFGEGYFSSLGPTGLSGLRVDNGVHLIFSRDSKVACHYTGDNYNVRHYFSPFNSSAGSHRGFTIEGLTLECSNVRYAIHDDTYGQGQSYKNVYRSCTVILDNSANSDGFPVCIGGGLGSDSEIVIEDCYFKSSYEGAHDIVSYHNGGDGMSDVSVNGCYFADGGTVRCSYYGPSQKMSRMTVHGCSLGSPPILNQESPEYTTVNMELLAFDNEVRGANGPTIIQAIIEAAGWTGEDVPYANTISIAGATSNNIIEISLQPCPTEEQVAACAGAMLVDGGQDGGSVTLLAMGEKPEIDIPITVVIW